MRGHAPITGPIKPEQMLSSLGLGKVPSILGLYIRLTSHTPYTQIDGQTGRASCKQTDKYGGHASFTQAKSLQDM